MNSSTEEFNINNYLRDCMQLIVKANGPFEKSAYVPTSNDIPQLSRDILNSMMANSQAVGFKLILSGPISQGEKTEKKQSFCSEYNQMIKNFVGLIGFEFSRSIMIRMATFSTIERILTDMEEATSYEELLQYTSYIYSTLKPFPKATYEFIHVPSENKLNQLVYKEDPIPEFFENERAQLRTHIASKNISLLGQNRRALIDRIKAFISTISSGRMPIECVDNLVTMNMGRYTILYQGSFIKVLEILYKSFYADNPKFNEANMQTISQYNAVERYIDGLLIHAAKQSAYYINYLEHYFMDVFKMTQDALLGDASIAQTVNKIDIPMPMTLITMLAKITLGAIAKLSRLINEKKNTLLMTSTPSRIQFVQVLESIFDLPPGIDVDWTLDQLVVIYYVLSCEKVIAVTNEKRKARAKKVKRTNRTKIPSTRQTLFPTEPSSEDEITSNSHDED